MLNMAIPSLFFLLNIVLLLTASQYMIKVPDIYKAPYRVNRAFLRFEYILQNWNNSLEGAFGS